VAVVQGVVADAVGDAIDAIKWRLGVGPDWRPAFRRRVIARAGRPDAADDDRQPIETIPPPRVEAQSPGDEWAGDPDWEEDAGVAGAVEDAADATAALPALPEDNTMMRPAGLSAPRSGVPDNLQRIRGIGRRNEELLHSLGIFHFGQIAAWTPAEARWVGAHLAFPERIERDDWIGQAIVLASGGETEYVKAVAERQKAAEREDGEGTDSE
jgi:predicted flap endonuclease-1-like 5' DNA nuclease